MAIFDDWDFLSCLIGIVKCIALHDPVVQFNRLKYS